AIGPRSLTLPARDHGSGRVERRGRAVEVVFERVHLVGRLRGQALVVPERDTFRRPGAGLLAAPGPDARNGHLLRQTLGWVLVVPVPAVAVLDVFSHGCRSLRSRRVDSSHHAGTRFK